jgi:hypothetical protein
MQGAWPSFVCTHVCLHFLQVFYEQVTKKEATKEAEHRVG